MIKQSELEVMVCDLFVDAYRAGASGQDGNYGTARVSRAKLIEKIGEIYDEIEDLKISNQAYEHELTKQNDEICRAKQELNERYGVAFNAMFEGCTTDDLPFPDIEPMAAAEEVEGANDFGPLAEPLEDQDAGSVMPGTDGYRWEGGGNY